MTFFYFVVSYVLAPVPVKITTGQWFGIGPHNYIIAVWLASGGRVNDLSDGTNPSARKFFIQPFSELYSECGCLRRIHVSLNGARWRHHLGYYAFSPPNKVVSINVFPVTFIVNKGNIHWKMLNWKLAEMYNKSYKVHCYF